MRHRVVYTEPVYRPAPAPEPVATTTTTNRVLLPHEWLALRHKAHMDALR